MSELFPYVKPDMSKVIFKSFVPDTTDRNVLKVTIKATAPANTNPEEDKKILDTV